MLGSIWFLLPMTSCQDMARSYIIYLSQSVWILCDSNGAGFDIMRSRCKVQLLWRGEPANIWGTELSHTVLTFYGHFPRPHKSFRSDSYFFESFDVYTAYHMFWYIYITYIVVLYLYNTILSGYFWMECHFFLADSHRHVQASLRV